MRQIPEAVSIVKPKLMSVRDRRNLLFPSNISPITDLARFMMVKSPSVAIRSQSKNACTVATSLNVIDTQLCIYI